MKVAKKVIGNLTKCYAIAPLTYKGKQHFLVAAEKQDPCWLFDLDGNKEDQIWDGPGGVMTMLQVPGSDGVFLATRKFYSPNDSKEASIVIASPSEDGWQVRKLMNLPYVHRFDILSRGGVNYLLACCIKSDYEYKDDWRFPGKCFAAVLPDDLSSYNENNPLPMKPIMEGMLKNHGYTRFVKDGQAHGIVSCDGGIYKFTPPASAGAPWEIRQLTDHPASDAVYCDFDGDGKEELGIICPFHGNRIIILKESDGVFKEVYNYPQETEFSHAIFGGDLAGKKRLVIGYRKGKRELLAFTFSEEKQSYEVQILDEDCGPANVFHYMKDGADILISTNRETDEIAMYRIEA